ncbi:hypothetical protein [Deinococcus yavapaiensis]|uniref:Uncharacterized protein n=1 Tax=Deinococcus yavapaiensis KR-236 TaxID=694435 RepID=A0A318SF08_9DEIO|nr:hypothetical protein [Deinococcus yavapaiensis]PYE51949.1 hypothetical protein DES52_114150 [Deinococcus yavapaiensis KR-236]
MLMDLESWTPSDKARRIAIAVAIQFAVFVFVLVWIALAWPWYAIVLAPLVAYVLAFYPVFGVLKKLIRR